MDDIHTLRKPPSRIPLLSPLLHFVSMTVVVHLRRSFGFDYLGEKRWFLIPAWAFSLFFFMAWNSRRIWQISPPFWIFGLATVAAYLFHLLTAFLREPTRDREDSTFSGRSYFLGVCRRLETPEWPAERLCHVCLEPALVFLLAVVVRLFFRDSLLSAWLVFAAGCLFTAEFFNYWFGEVRKPIVIDEAKKKAEEEAARAAALAAQNQDAVKPTRNEEDVPQRNARPVDEELEDDKFARVLEMEPPYSLELADAQYRALIARDHSDKNQMSPESHERSLQLNEAREYFRERLRR